MFKIPAERLAGCNKCGVLCGQFFPQEETVEVTAGTHMKHGASDTTKKANSTTETPGEDKPSGPQSEGGPSATSASTKRPWSATESTMNASRPQPPFRDMADRRNARREQNISMSFDPAMEASKKKFAETLGRPTKKKKIGTKTPSSASATSTAASSKPTDTKEEWNVGLVEDTDAVYRDKYSKPDRDKVMALYQQRAKNNAKPRNTTSDMLKKLFYIALPRGAPNLPLKVMSKKAKENSDVEMDDDEDYQGDDEDQTVPGDNNEPSTAESKMESKAQPKGDEGPGDAQDHPMHQDQSTDEYIFNTYTNIPPPGRTSDDEPPTPPPEEDFGSLPPADYLVATRLVTFMARPTSDQSWVGDFAIGFPHFANLSTWTAADESEFDAVFALGPGAFSVLTQFLTSVYDIFCKELFDTQDPSVIAARRKYYHSATDLLILVKKVRSKYDRSLWDPAGGFRELAVLLHKNSHRLPDGDPNSRMYRELQKINMSTMSVEHVKFHLRDAFHAATDPSEMYEDVVCLGPFGLDGFYSGCVHQTLGGMKMAVMATRIKNHAEHDHRAPQVQVKLAIPKQENGEYQRTQELILILLMTLASEWHNDVKETMDDIKTRRSRRHPVSVHDSDSEPERAESGRTNTKPRPSTFSKPRPEPAASSVPKPKPRPRPIPVESARVREARRLVDEKLPLEALMTRILRDWPHPKPERHPKMDSWSALPLKKKAQKLQLVYHYDKNVNETEEWRKISAALATALNLALESASL
ncbi:hypothetical protein ARMSODRAFT_975839 [Armillaria solidipes]|uniref:Uncharacterized protein n=1 Tax=Armillaria solidipes TaxID=1076256 RepID=A0A2H3BN87_9AGAR|nr:hypothetical protein ARMSODRAFT_975839 [Armillaria solidipes]